MDITIQSEFITRLYSLIQGNLPDNESQEISAEMVREVVYRISDAIFANSLIKVNSLVNEPPSPVYPGDTFLVGTNPSGDFTGKSGKVARFNESMEWEFLSPINGMSVFTKDGKHWYFYQSPIWKDIFSTILKPDSNISFTGNISFSKSPTTYDTQFGNNSLLPKSEIASLINSAISAHNSNQLSHNDIRLAISTLQDMVNTQADWNQNDDTSIDYIKNRTHWVESSVVDVTSLISVTYIRENGQQLLNDFWDGQNVFVVGNTYKILVSIMGVESEYSVVCTLDSNTFHTQLCGSFSEALDGAYFDMDSPDNNNLKLYTGSTPISDYTFKIVSTKEVYNKLDEKYIPDMIARKSYVDDIDSNLQQQIDAITSSTDVRDVLGTYAELLAYDTSVLFNNDVVKVLVDENKNNAISYYRWVITEGVGAWSYVGSQGPFYTKAESDSKYATKNELQTGLSSKADDTNVLHKTGAETATGVKTFSDGIKIASVDVQYDTTKECLKFVFN